MVTSLDEHAYTVDIKAGDYLKGYRLKPGTLITRESLLNAVKMLDMHGDITDRLGNFTSLSSHVEDALHYLGKEGSVSAVASGLGVSMRSMQRLLKSTGRTPAGWVSLARARKAARAAAGVGCLAETALAYGYADQSHMSREFRRWFNVSPAQINKQTAILSQLEGLGYF